MPKQSYDCQQKSLEQSFDHVNSSLKNVETIQDV